MLITGENGTGKELVARAIHRLSARADAPLVEVNCAAIPEELIESELFGHEKGSFTGASEERRGKFEEADGATLFLDEVGDMSPKTQAKVLRALQEGRFTRVGGTRAISSDARVLSATNKDLPAEIRRGRSGRTSTSGSRSCRSRCRRCATGPRTSRCSRGHFLAEASARFGRKPKALSPAALEAPPEPPLAGQRARAQEPDRARRDPFVGRRDRARRTSTSAATATAPKARDRTRPSARRATTSSAGTSSRP